MLEQRGAGGTDLDHRAVRSQVATQYDDAARALERVGAAADHVVIENLRTLDVLAQRLAVDAAAVQVQQVFDFAE